MSSSSITSATTLAASPEISSSSSSRPLIEESLLPPPVTLAAEATSESSKSSHVFSRIREIVRKTHAASSSSSSSSSSNRNNQSKRLSRPPKYEYDPLESEDEAAESREDRGGEDGPLGEATVVYLGPQPRHRRSRFRRICSSACGTMCGMILIILLLLFNALLMISRTAYGVEPDPDAIFRWGEPGTGTEDKAWYPTDFLRDVTPIPCHSHNDYWRRVPLFSALHAGCIGVEADVWLLRSHKKDREQDLFVGHNRAALQPNRTFESLYVQPLLEILERQNKDHGFFENGTDGESGSGTTSDDGRRRGVFDADPDQTLVLMVDIKTSGPATFRRVLEQLEPLRARGYLTTFSHGVVHQGPITVVGSGNTPFDVLMENSTYRYVFYDAPLEKLEDDASAGVRYDYTNSYYSSVALGPGIGHVWLGSLRSGQLRRLRHQLRIAHDRGLMARYWDLPLWPISVRNAVWDTLVSEGVDILNVDDLRGATRGDWSEGNWV